jgi:hypothetical protein
MSSPASSSPKQSLTTTQELKGWGIDFSRKFAPRLRMSRSILRARLSSIAVSAEKSSRSFHSICFTLSAKPRSRFWPLLMRVAGRTRGMTSAKRATGTSSNQAVSASNSVSSWTASLRSSTTKPPRGSALGQATRLLRLPVYEPMPNDPAAAVTLPNVIRHRGQKTAHKRSAVLQ